MKRWKLFFPLLHDPYNGKWVKLIATDVKFKLQRATIDDLMEAYECDRKTAKQCYETGNSPAWTETLSRARTRKEGE